MKSFKSIDQLRAAYKTPERTTGNLPNNYYPFWNMKEGERAVIRFLPDTNDDNPLGFLVEKVMHTLTINGEKKSIPCLSMYGDKDCPICKVSQDYYSKDDKDNGKTYWKKKQYIAQVLVVEDPIVVKDGEESHEGKVRYVALGYNLFKIIKDAFESGELDEVPFSYTEGTNFIIKKTKQGEYANYALSKFDRKSSALDEDTVAGLNLIDLSSLLPKHPGREKVEAQLEAALTGTEYHDESATARKPNLDKTDVPKTTAAVKEATTKPVVSKATATEDSDEEIDGEVASLLADIKNRRSKREAV